MPADKKPEIEWVRDPISGEIVGAIRRQYLSLEEIKELYPESYPKFLKELKDKGLLKNDR